MDSFKFQIEIPDSVYAKLEAHINVCVTNALQAHIQTIQSQSKKLTRQEAAKMLRISLPTLDKYRDEGLLSAQTIGKRVLFPISEIEKFLNRNK